MGHIKKHTLNRRRFLSLSGALLTGAVLPGSFLTGCSKTLPPIQIASNIWAGYEFLFLARELKLHDKDLIKMVELPSASVCLEALAAGTVDGACLTLDEVLTAKSEGLELQVVTVLDTSLGADVILTHSKYKSLEDLKGMRIGVEQSAVGAVMLHSALDRFGLKVSDFQIVHMNVNRHREAFLSNHVDALITFEPVISQLLKHNTSTIFSSADVPGRIVDVIAIRPESIKRHPEAVSNLVASHFAALKIFQETPDLVTPIMSNRLKIEASEVVGMYNGVSLPGIEENKKYLMGSNPTLNETAKTLSQIMKDAKLLTREPALGNLANGNYLPG